MDKRQIEHWAIEADQDHAGMDCVQFGGSIVSVSTLERFAALVAAHEREQCQKAADDQWVRDPALCVMSWAGEKPLLAARVLRAAIALVMVLFDKPIFSAAWRMDLVERIASR